MRIRRRTLYLGVFLITFGAVWLLGRGQSVAPWVTGALALWPAVVIVFGVALLLRGTRLALLGGIAAAIVPGLLLGGVAVAAPDMSLACGPAGAPASVVRDGAFSGPATVDLELACGRADVTTAPGAGWTVSTADVPDAPVVVSAFDRLSVTSAARRPGAGLAFGSDRWHVTLPTDVPFDLATSVDAGAATLDLGGASVGRAELTVNAGALDARFDGATLARLLVEVHAGAATIRLPSDSTFTGSIDVAAGSVRLCVPDGLGLRVRRSGDLGSFSAGPLVANGSLWESPDIASAAHTADLSLDINVGSVDIVSEGACR